LDFGYSWDGQQSALLFEIRPQWNDPTKILELLFAKLRFVKSPKYGNSVGCVDLENGRLMSLNRKALIYTNCWLKLKMTHTAVFWDSEKGDRILSWKPIPDCERTGSQLDAENKHLYVRIYCGV
jgi:hypothetical protein